MNLLNEEYMTPKDASEIIGVHFQTLRNWEKEGKIEAIRTPGNKRYYNVKKFLKLYRNDEEIILPIKKEKRNICYCRVSSESQKDDLENQIKYMKEKYPTFEILSDIGSGINFKRKNLKVIINLGLKNELGTLAIAYKDRLCRIAYDLIADILIENSETKIIIENKSNQSFEQELADDMIQIITVFSSRLYGMRSYKNRILNKL
jgi:predicted site-specific integrase-resolvase